MPYCEARDVIALRRSVDLLRAALAEPVPTTPDRLPELPPKMILDLSAVGQQIGLLRGESRLWGPAVSCAVTADINQPRRQQQCLTKVRTTVTTLRVTTLTTIISTH